MLEGVKPGERIVVTGLQRIRPGAKVVAKPATELASAVPQDITKSEKPPQTQQVLLTTEGTTPASPPASTDTVPKSSTP